MVKQKVLEFANRINGTKAGMPFGIKPEDPEYKILEPVVTDEMAEVGLCLKVKDPMTAEEVAKKCGKPLEETKKLLWDLAVAGACFMATRDGVDKYWLVIWVPGHMEMMVNNVENVKKYPQIGRAFEEYTRRRVKPLIGNAPVGAGLMRVLPIEKAIESGSRSASYEEVSKYINESDVISVSNCSCRTAREAMGEGCGHLKEDMCIQLGEAAEYYIRTGRGRKVTKQEAFDILKRAEENGLVHEIPNMDGPGKTHAICNCCGCGCLSLRLAELYKDSDVVRSNYVAEVDKDKCMACGECVENCQVNAVKLGQKICTKTPVEVKEEPNPRNTEWGKDKWNPDYRINRKVVVDTGTSPCKAECPAHIGIQAYIKLASQGKYTDALELIKEENPFPAVCGRICSRRCESACTRNDVDDPVAIDDIKKFIAQQDLNKEKCYVPELKHHYGNKIAIIGAGPAGLSCAYYLAVDGYKVTVFEKQKVLGGMLALGIPSFRLEKDVVNAEIDILKELGVEFKTGVEVGKDVSLNDLRGRGYEAFYLAIGAQSGRKLGVEGEDAEGVVAGVDFLRDVNLGKEVKLDGDVVVIGGGNVAIDVARTAVRTDASSVSMYCLESRKEMPSLDEEIEEAEGEGIKINNSWGPKRVLVENGHVTGVEFKKCVSVFDENKRFSPKYDENNTKVVKADHVLLSIGQSIEWGGLLKDSKIELNRNKTVKADPVTYETGDEDVFTGGDVLTGPKFAIDAIAVGKQGAISIHRFVHHGQSLVLGRTKRDYRPLDKDNLNLEGYDRLPRQKANSTGGDKSKNSFRDLRGTLTEEQVMKETERCLACGAAVVDAYRCIGCGVCTIKCRFEAIKLVKKYDSPGVDPDKWKSTIVKHAIKRQLNIAAKAPTKFFKKTFAGKKN